MVRDERLLKVAAKEAGLVDYKWRLGSVVAIGSRVLSTGRVQWRHHSSLNPATSTRHAEESALKSLLSRSPKG